MLQGGDTPLHYAACFGHMEIVSLLIIKGADIIINIKNKVSILVFAFLLL